MTLSDVQDWVETPEGADGKDIDDTVWYKKEWESKIEDLCSKIGIFYWPLSCNDLYLDYFAKMQAKENVPEIVNPGECFLDFCMPDTVSYSWSSIHSSLDDDTLYYCQYGDYQVREQCSDGCEKMDPYVDDRCY
ncbi:MAG: hypothetical protein ACL93V_06985 [Candidatus Electrothrix sp. YB6]